jgi:hypothetical protein
LREPKKTISKSRFQKLLECGIAFKFNYIDKIPGLWGLNPLIGIAIHDFQEIVFEHWFINGVLPEWDHVKHIPVQLFDAVIKGKKLKFNQEQSAKGEVATIAYYRNIMTDCCEFYLSDIAPKLTPTDMEKEVRVVRGDYEIYSRFDLLQENGFRDLKTMGKLTKPNVNMQYGFYALAYLQEFGKMPEIYQDTLVFKKSGISYHPFKVNVTEKHLKIAEYMIVYYQDLMKNKHFVCAPEYSNSCTSTQCGYWNICDYHF